MEFINLDFTLPSGRGCTLCRFPFPPSSQLDNLVKLHCFQGCLLWERGGLDVIRLFTAVHLFLSRGLNLIAPRIFLLIVCFSSSGSRQPAKTRRKCWKGGGRRAVSLHRGRHFIKLPPRGMCLLRRSLTHHVLDLQSRCNLGIVLHG